MLASVFQKGTEGVPTTTPVASIRNAGEIAFSHASFWGCTSATIRIAGTLDEAFQIADAWLGNGVEIRHDDGDLLWGGLVWSIKFGAGTRARKRSLDGFATAARTVFNNTSYGTVPPTVGAQTSNVQTDADLIAVYGYIETVIQGGNMAAGAATALTVRTLADRKRLLYAPEGGGKDGTIEIECRGWYRTLFYRAYTNTTTAGTSDIASVVQAILVARAPMLVADYSQLQATGTNIPSYFDKAELAGDIVKRVVGTAANGAIFGIGLDRIPYLRPSNRLSTTVTYIERGNGVITDASGGKLDPWDVRPDAVLRQADFVPATVASTVALDEVANVYLQEVTYSTMRGLSYKAAIAGINGAISAQ